LQYIKTNCIFVSAWRARQAHAQKINSSRCKVTFDIFWGMTTTAIHSKTAGTEKFPYRPSQVESTAYESPVNQSLGLKVSKCPPAAFCPFPARISRTYVQSIKSIGVCLRSSYVFLYVPRTLRAVSPPNDWF